MHWTIRVVCFAALLAIAGWGQGNARLEAALRKSGVRVFAESTATGSVAVRIRLPQRTLVDGASASGTTDQNLVLSTLREFSAPAKRERFSELVEGMIVAVALDGKGTALHWTAQADPRRVRAEFPRPDGVLNGQMVDRPEADLFVDLPSDTAIREVGLFSVVRTVGGLDLDRLGTAPVPRPSK